MKHADSNCRTNTKYLSPNYLPNTKNYDNFERSTK